MKFYERFQKNKEKLIPFLTIVIIVISSFIVYLNSFIPRYNSASFDFIKEGLFNQCVSNVISKYRVDEITAQEQCKLLVEKEGDKFVKAYEDFYTGPEGRYLTGIDPYYYYRLTKNIINERHYYEILKDYDINVDGKKEKVPYDDKQYAPPGHPIGEVPFWSVFEAYSFKIWSSMFPEWKDKLMGFLFWLPVFLAPLSAVFAYLIGRRLFNDWIGLFFGIMMVFNVAFLTRSYAGFADTDALNVVLPLLSLWLFILSFYEKSIIKKSIYGVLSAFVLGIFSWHWQGWWYALWIVIAWLGFKGLEYLWFYYKENKDLFKKSSILFVQKFLSKPKIKELLVFSFAYIFVSLLFVSFFTSIKNFIYAFLQPFNILLSYDKPFSGYWPNTLLTVAEANDVGNLKDVINSVFNFGIVNFKFFAWLGIIGAIWFTYESIKSRRWERLALIFWLIAAIIYSMQGVRFLMYLGVPLALFSAYALYKILDVIIELLTKDDLFKKVLKISFMSATTLILLGLSTKIYNILHATGEFNDNWYKTMEFIKNNDFKVITSWWDFGHYFIAMTKKMTTFDGASQTTPRAFWVGKALQSPENLSKQIITDLATNGDDFFNFIITYLSALELNYSKEEALKIAKERIKDEEENVLLYFQKNYDNWDKLYYGTFNGTAIGVNILLKILPLKREEAYKKLINGIYLEQTNKTYKFDRSFAKILINLTHPLNPNKVAFITSQDMVGKAGAWGALGNWDFFNPPKTKEEFYSRAKFYITSNFVKYKINNSTLYLTKIKMGSNVALFIFKNNSLFLGNLKFKTPIECYLFNKTNLIKLKGKDIGEDLLIILENNKPTKLVMMSKGLINATFTRMWFMDGYGLKYFKKVYENPSNPKIIVWSLN